MNLDGERWRRIDYTLELLKQEGDLATLQAFEDILESMCAWRFTAQWVDRAENQTNIARSRDAYRSMALELAPLADRQHFLLRDIRALVEPLVQSGLVRPPSS